MKTPTLLMIAAVSLAAIPGLAQSMSEDHDHAAMQEKASAEMSCADMMKMREGMQEKMQANDARLNELVERMNAAQGSTKVDQMAAVVNELVNQRREMHKGMMTMQPMMMRHMMKHMQGAVMKGMSEGMSNCPMMGMAGEADSDSHQH